MASAAPTSSQASPPHRPPIQTANPASPPNKRDLKSWWKGFKLPSKNHEASDSKAPGIFGIPLRQSITYANVAISLIDEHGQSYIYGYVPIVVAKCGVFLKEKATGVEGIFRLSGSEKRIKELKLIFDSPDRYGKGLVWEGYTVHDASNVLRRYLNDLPEPVVPLDLYEKFRDPLRGATKQAVGDAEGPQFVENFDEMAAIERYQMLITELPPLNRQLLLYILDLLAVFAAKSDENRMNSQNLAAIFQPGMLSHPAHAMAPEEYRLNQCVLIFLIENQDHFLIGMQGTAADETTMKEVESGTPKGPLTPNPNRKSGLGRSASNASAGAHSVRKDGQIRRNRSVSSKHSKNDGTSSPNSPATATTPTTGSLGRSNTVPSKKSPALVGGKFRKLDSPSRRSPASGTLAPLTQARPVEELEEPGASNAIPAAVVIGSIPEVTTVPPNRNQDKLLEVPQETSTPSKDRGLQNLFQRSPTDGSDKRQPNKLKKKRLPGALNQSAHSSTVSLSHSNTASPSAELADPLEQMPPLVPPPSSQPTSQPISHPASSRTPPPTEQSVVQTQAAPAANAELSSVQPLAAQQQQQQQQQQQPEDLPAEPHVLATHTSPNETLHPHDAARGKKSPPASLHSSFNEGSDFEQPGDGQTVQVVDSPEKDKRRRWRLSSRARKDDNNTPGNLLATSPPQMNIGTNDKAEMSVTSIGSGSNKLRKSFAGDSSEHLQLNAALHDSSHEGSKDDNDSKGPLGWIKSKYREAKENAEQRRNKSPPPDRQGLAGGFLSRGKSLDMKREHHGEKHHKEDPAEAINDTEKSNVAELSAGGAQDTAKAEPVKVEPVLAPQEALPPAPQQPQQDSQPPAQKTEPAPSTSVDAPPIDALKTHIQADIQPHSEAQTVPQPSLVENEVQQQQSLETPKQA